MVKIFNISPNFRRVSKVFFFLLWEGWEKLGVLNGAYLIQFNPFHIIISNQMYGFMATCLMRGEWQHVFLMEMHCTLSTSLPISELYIIIYLVIFARVDNLHFFWLVNLWITYNLHTYYIIIYFTYELWLRLLTLKWALVWSDGWRWINSAFIAPDLATSNYTRDNIWY